jgi:hypothetical protein
VRATVVAGAARGRPHRLAAYATFPIPQIEVVRDPSGGTHTDTIATASEAGVPVVEVDR